MRRYYRKVGQGLMRMPFGKHKGEDLTDVPLDYLKWAEENLQIDILLRREINHEIERREGDRPGKGIVRPKIHNG